MHRSGFRPRKKLTLQEEKPAPKEMLVLKEHLESKLGEIGNSTGLDGAVAVLVRGIGDVLVEELLNVERSMKEVEFAFSKLLRPIAELASEIRGTKADFERRIAAATKPIQAELTNLKQELKSDIGLVKKAIGITVSTLDGIKASVEEENDDSQETAVILKAIDDLGGQITKMQKRKAEWDGEKVVVQALDTILDKIEKIDRQETTPSQEFEQRLSDIAKALSNRHTFKVMRDGEGNITGWTTAVKVS